MKFQVKKSDFQKVAADVLVVWCDAEGNFGRTLKDLDKESEGFFSQLKETNDLPKMGEVVSLVAVPHLENKRVIICGLKPQNGQCLKSTCVKLWEVIAQKGWEKCALALDDFDIKDICRFILSHLSDAAYRFDTFKNLTDDDKAAAKFAEKVQIIWLSDDENAKADLVWVQARMAGTYLTRDLGNTPANVCTPSWLGEQAKQLADKYETMETKLHKKKELTSLKMGALLAVAQGSEEEPRLIEMSYKPNKFVNKQPIVLVGKGVTFDAGGISLKPAADMDLMKYDMGGAAAVFGAMKAIAEAQLPVHVIALIPAVENLPSGKAVKPGDIVTSMSGKTIEVLNTDAEGRLILCDALTYAEKFKPQAVIDLATLTGAVVIALGSPRAGLFGNDAALVEELFEAGEIVYDRAWKMPLDVEYKDMMKSPFADLANISGSREAGSITAAAFLSNFTESYSWAHIDIAGIAWNSGKAKGSSGRPVGMLLEYFQRLAEKA
ncbi:leucyl aminopeptidase [Suttonella ornithocola]|uniref:Probable cytosol aminopeptidase n=1 Tax=Suttonella ornithocola TaxID=279832 RepID=A0A380MWA3_9GAMM|nr:leucyl aminopeptidase [Suttonella ornithocola]SUO95991.1 Cytosol aminopeptidase [Suttonella ornithocola]